MCMSQLQNKVARRTGCSVGSRHALFVKTTSSVKMIERMTLSDLDLCTSKRQFTVEI